MEKKILIIVNLRINVARRFDRVFNLCIRCLASRLIETSQYYHYITLLRNEFSTI